MIRRQLSVTALIITGIVAAGCLVGRWTADVAPRPPEVRPDGPLVTIEVGVANGSEHALLDLGEVQTSTEARGAIILLNRTGERLKIADVVSTCGCTLIEYPRGSIGINDTVQIDVSMSASSIPERTRVKTLAVVFENQIDPVRIDLRCTAVPFVIAEPARLIVSSGEELCLELFSPDGTRFRVLETDPPIMEFEAARQAAEHDLRASEERLRALAALPEFLRIRLDHPKVAEFTVPIRDERPSGR